jgi:hypothetical protein
MTEARPYKCGVSMAEKLDPRQVATFEELLRAMMYETEAVRTAWSLQNGEKEGWSCGA